MASRGAVEAPTSYYQRVTATRVEGEVMVEAPGDCCRGSVKCERGEFVEARGDMSKVSFVQS